LILLIILGEQHQLYSFKNIQLLFNYSVLYRVFIVQAY
jgi:hypothetical protein